MKKRSNMRSHYCGKLSTSDCDLTVRLCGWVSKSRDHGGVIFIDLRDSTGRVQVVCNPEDSKVFGIAEGVRNEYCLWIEGTVRKRPEGSENSNLLSGGVEVVCLAMEVLNESKTPPFPLEDESINENTRLIHRVIDLRTEQMQRNIFLRHTFMQEVRLYLNKLNFLDIETPVLTKSTPEGARDFLVGSRQHNGNFFALPQSPQLFKQLLMVAGFDRYYQITKCFRDEDLRADRQPEFTQIDCETTFLSEEEIMQIFEEMIITVFKKVAGISLQKPFQVLTYEDAIKKYGSDKPDLRVKLELCEITEIVEKVSFKIFSEAAKSGGKVSALRVPGGEKLSRGEIDELTDYIKIFGAKGLAWIKVHDLSQGKEGLQSPIVKNIEDDALKAILKILKAQNGDIIFFGAGSKKIVSDSLSAVMLKIGHSKFGKEQGLFEDIWSPLWVVDFPMFEFDSEKKKWDAMHHPFTSPKDGHEDDLSSNPENCKAKAYDMVINGTEVGGGSVRIHNTMTQLKVFDALGIKQQEANEKFGFLLEALRYGAPPHGGIAFGLDRLVALICGVQSIRDVIPFPKTQRGQCLLTGAPSSASKSQLDELGINIKRQV